MTRLRVSSSIVAVAKVKAGSVAGRGEGVLILLRRSLGVSFRLGSERKEGFGEEEDCDLVTRLSASVEAAEVAADAAVAAVEAVAASSTVSSSHSFHGHMKGNEVERQLRLLPNI